MPGEALLPPLILELRARAGEVHGELAKVGTEVKALDRETAGGLSRSQKAFSGLAGAGKTALLGIGGAAVAIGAEGLHMGIDFQEATTQLVTGAGESEDAIGKVRSGILAMAGKVGQTPIDLAHGMYLVESAGFHASEGLKVLQAAAEGAKIGGADMTTVADGLTTALTDYHLSASQSADVTSKLVATVGAGKTTMGDLSGALAHVLPFAAGLHVSFNDVMGSMATMTGQGIHAADAATYLKFAMMALGNETPKGTKALQSVGLTAGQVHDSLGTHGLSGTLAMITEAVGKKFPAGSAEYTAAIAAIVGGTRGMAATLALTGAHASTLTKNIKTIGAASTETGGHVKGWAQTQEDLGTQIAQAKASLEAMVTTIGMALIPYVEDAIRVITGIVGWFREHTTAAKILGGVILTVLVAAIGAYIGKLVWAATQSVINFGKMVASGAVWVAEQAAGLASSVAGMIAWAAEHALMAGSFITENLAMAASATAAFVAENAATLGIGVAIAAVVAAVVWLATHWKEAWNAIEAAVMWVWRNAIKPVGEYLVWWFRMIVDAGRIAYKFLVNDVLRPIASGFSDLWGAIQSVASGVASIFEHFWDGLLSAGAHVFNWIATAWNDTLGKLNFKIPSWVPGIGGDGFGFPTIPLISGYATGGFVGDGLVMFGENGPELGYKSGSQMRMFSNAVTNGMRTPGGSDGGSGGGGAHVVEVHSHLYLDGTQIHEQVERTSLQVGARRGQSYTPFKRGGS